MGVDKMEKRLLVFSGLIGFLLSTVLIPVCRAGVVIEEIHRNMEGRMSRVIRYFSGDQFRTDHPEGGVSTIIDFKGDRIILIDHSSRSYVEIKFSLSPHSSPFVKFVRSNHFLHSCLRAEVLCCGTQAWVPSGHDVIT